MSQVNTTFKVDVKDYCPSGLTSAQAKVRLQQYGENTFTKEKTNAWKIFGKQFINPLSFILIFAAGLSIFMGEYSDAVVIMVIVALNSVLSFIQEYRSSKAVEKLSGLIKRQVLVIRNDEHTVIDASKLVPGDTIILRGGDVVPADVKIIESYDLSVSESQLTGESIPVSKGTNTDNVKDTLIYTGSVIERGHCNCIVCATGNQSELGKIARLSKDTKKVTPYQKSLAEFSIWLLRLIGATVVLLLTVKAFTIGSTGEFIEVLLFAVALAMASVPEALPMITTINLSYGAQQLAKENVIVKRLNSIEGLGRINLLCTDKTGTLTEDRLTIKDITSDNKELFQKFAYATIEDLKVKNKKYINSFDRAFMDYIPKSIKTKVEHWEQLEALPFDPAARRRRMIIADKDEQKSYLVVVGAPETLMNLSNKENSRIYKQPIAKSGSNGWRQLAIAYKEIEHTTGIDILENEKDLTFLGFVNLVDPLRKTAKATIRKAKELGVDVKILTGDSLEVAAYVGREVGLGGKSEKIYLGDELDKMTDTELEQALEQCSIFARVTPEQKYNLIKRLKSKYVVGYQGDGINDAPSLKLADVSVAVHNATDVAKDSADIVLLEDNLEVIINAIKYGRSIFININKYVKHAMIGNLGNFFSLIFFYLVFAADIPMLAIQLLIGNIIQDMPLMAVFSDSVDEKDIQKSQSASQINSIVKTSVSLGVFTAVYYLLFFLFTGTESTPMTQSTLFLFYNFTQILVVLSVRNKGFFWQGVKPSRLLVGTIVMFMALSVALVYIPFTAGFMGFLPLSLMNLSVVCIVTVGYIFFLDLAKMGINKLSQKRSYMRLSKAR